MYRHTCVNKPAQNIWLFLPSKILQRYFHVLLELNRWYLKYIYKQTVHNYLSCGSIASKLVKLFTVSEVCFKHLCGNHKNLLSVLFEVRLHVTNTGAQIHHLPEYNRAIFFEY